MRAGRRAPGVDDLPRGQGLRERRGLSRTPAGVSIPIRPASARDLAVLTQLYYAVRAEIRSLQTAGFVADTADEDVLVAEQQGEVVGFVSVYRPESFVHHLYVAAEARGRGVGAALLIAGTARLAGRPWLKVDAHNTTARDFYRRLGWREDAPGEAGDVVVVRGPATP